MPESVALAIAVIFSLVLIPSALAFGGYLANRQPQRLPYRKPQGCTYRGPLYSPHGREIEESQAWPKNRRIF